jgi:hypothetical protein
MRDLNTLRNKLKAAGKTMTYGDAARTIGFWTRGKFKPHAFRNLLISTWKMFDWKAPDLIFINARTGKPGPGAY